MKYNLSEHFKIISKSVVNGRTKQIGEFYLILDGKTYSTVRGLLNNLRKHNYTSKQYYDEFYKTECDGKCVECGKNTSYGNLLIGYNKYCADSCYTKSSKHKIIISNRFVDNDEKKVSSDKKRKVSMSKKTDTERLDIKRRTQETVKIRYGETYLSDRVTEQWKNASEEDIRKSTEKANQTKLKNGTMGFDLFKNTNKSIMFGDKLFYCQGYEDAVLYFLQDIGLIPDVCTGKDVPRINTTVNKSGIYRPDMYIEKLNLLIEVKSDFTFSHDMKRYMCSVNKQRDSMIQGYNHVLFVIKSITKDRKLFETDKECFMDYLNMSISSQALNGKVQRLSDDSEYRPNAIGSGSARVPIK